MVAAHGHRAAVSDDRRTLTYREVDQASDRLASRLRLLPRDARRIVVMLPRSIEAALAFLAILKAGSTYVPLDPQTPPQRVAAMLGGLRMDAVICATTCDAAPCGDAAVITVALDDLLTPGADGTVALPADTRDREQEAYIMFTSGSTGAPKGVSIPDRAIARLAIDPAFVAVAATDVLLHFAPIAFDASTFEIWAAWLNGAELAIYTDPQPTPTTLGQFLASHRCSIAWFTVGLFNTLVDTNPAVLAPLRSILTGGDALSPDHVARAFAALPAAEIINGYGPTENTTFTCCHRIPRAPDLARWSNIPIGRAIAGTTVHIVDDALVPVPAGTEGELLTGGDGVALGYCNDVELTAAKFVPAPRLGPGRYYRTGDRAVLRADGEIEFRGRGDDQVKINGYRIEPQEIATRLTTHPGVQDAVVVPRSVGRGGKRLVGYVKVEPNAPEPFAEEALKRWLQESLPPAWVPTRLIALPTFPLTPNGKIDRAALPNPFGANPVAAVATPTDAAAGADFLAVVASVLQVGEVSPADSFLTAGGDSLSAMVVIDQWALHTGRMLTVDRLLSCTPLSSLAAGAPAVVPPAPPGPADGIPHGDTTGGPMSLSQEQVWFLARARPHSLSYNVNCRLVLRGADRAALHRSLEAVFRRHDLLHAVLVDQPHTPIPRWERRPDWPLPLTWIDLTGLTPAAAIARFEAEFTQRMQEPFELRNAPLIRWFGWELPGAEMHLLQCEHHLIHDGWSLERLLRDWATTYATCLPGRPPPPAGPRPRSYFDLSRWQRRLLETAGQDPSCAFWRTKLTGMPHFRLPADTLRRKTPVGGGKPPTDPIQPEGRVLRREVPAALVARVTAAAQANGISLFEYFLATFVGWLGMTTGGEEVGLGIGIANRTQRTFADTLGLFVNMVTLRTPAPVEPATWATFQQGVAQGLRETWPHQHVPFEQVVRQVNPPRVADQNPFFEVLFSMHQRLPRQDWFDGTLIDYEEAIDNHSAKFDLTAFLIQEPATGAGSPPRIWLRWEYRAERFDASAMATRFDQYLHLLETALQPRTCLEWTTPHTAQPASARTESPPEEARPPELSDRAAALAGLQQAIITIWGPLFPGETIGPDSNFFHIGGHSLLGMELIVALETFFDRRLPLNSIFEAPTPRAFAALLQDDRELPTLSLSRLNQTSGPPLIFVHGWAGDAFCLLNLGRALEGSLCAYGLHADPQHGNTFTTLEDLAESYAAFLDAKLQLTEYQLGGYSVGGVLACAVAQALQRRGRTVSRLLIIDTRPYRLPPLLNLWVHRQWSYWRIKARLHELVTAGPRKGTALAGRIVRTLLGRLPKTLNGTTGPIIQPIIPPGARVDHYQVLAGSWRPRPFATAVDLVWSTNTGVDLPAAWKNWTSGPISVRRVQGQHLLLLQAPLVTEVAAAIIDQVHGHQS